MIYFDTSYIVRLYLQDPGANDVRKVAARSRIASCALGRVETVAAFHRKLREGDLSPTEYSLTLSQFLSDCADGAFRWLSITEAVVEDVQKAYERLPKTVFLRSSDAIHLACAARNGLREIHSNDKKLLGAASHFGLRGVDILETSQRESE